MNKLIFVFLIFCLSGCNVVKDIFTPSSLTKLEKRELRKKERCNKKLERLTKKCPELLQATIDTVEVYTSVDSQSIAKTFSQNKNVSGVDSIISKYQMLLDSSKYSNDSLINIVLNNLGIDIKKYIIKRPCITDSIYVDTIITINVGNEDFYLEIRFGAYPSGNNTQAQFLDIKSQNFKSNVLHETKKVSQIELTLKEQIYRIWREIWWIIILIVASIFILYKIFK